MVKVKSSTDIFNDAILALINNFGWKNVAFVIRDTYEMNFVRKRFLISVIIKAPLARKDLLVLSYL